MSKSLKRVIRALDAAEIDATPVEMREGARTAQAAADTVGCALDQIAKSIIFRGKTTGKAVLFITAGGNQVCRCGRFRCRRAFGQGRCRSDPQPDRFCRWWRVPGWTPVADPRIFRSETAGLRYRLGRRRHPVPRLSDKSGRITADFRRATY